MKSPWVRTGGALLAWGSVAVALLCFFGAQHYVFEILTAFRLQWMLASAGLALIWLFFRQWRWAACALVAAILHGWGVLPYAIPESTTPWQTSTPTLKIMQANVQYKNRDYVRFKQAVAQVNPDVLVVEEAMDHWFKQLAWQEDFRKRFPYRVGHWQQEKGVYSKYPLIHPTQLILQPDNLAAERPDELPHNAQVVTVQHPAGTLGLVVVHLFHPSGQFHAWRQHVGVTRLMNGIPQLQQTHQLPEAYLVVGDFNAVPWSYEVGRIKTALNLTHTSAKNPSWEVWPQTTWPAQLPGLLQIPLDQVLLSPALTGRAHSQTGQPFGSDHLPLITDIAFPSSKP